MEFDEWYAREHPRMLAAVAVAAGDVSLAEEATAEAFARALERWERVSQMDSPAGWVFTVARNLLRRRWTRRRIRARLLEGHGPDRTERFEPLQAEIWETVAQLPPRQREAVALRYIADLTEAQVAEAMGVAPGTVASTLHDARARLRPLLSDRRDDVRSEP